MFKKKKNKRKQSEASAFCLSTVTGDEAQAKQENGQEEEDDASAMLVQRKLVIQMKRRKVGLSTEELAQAALQGPGGENEGGEKSDKTASETGKVGQMEFRQASGVVSSDKAFIENSRQAFIEEQLRQAKQGQETSSSTSSGSSSSSAQHAHLPSDMQKAMENPEDFLYSVPDDLKKYMHNESTLLKSQEDGTKWLTGIAEVDLPASNTINNIERTQQAIEDMTRNLARKKETTTVGRGNFSNNFQMREERFKKKTARKDLIRFKKGQQVAR